MKQLQIGSSDFKNIITNNYYYVDKSLFIKEIINSPKETCLLPRPRRFGKTLNLSMLKYFFDINEPENKKLFTDLKIWQTGNDIKQHCVKYPVIYLTFKDAKSKTWDKTLAHIKSEIAKTYKEHRYLLNDNILFEEEKNIFIKILNKTAKETDFEESLKQLSEYLYRHHKEKVIILTDEYDTPIQAGYKIFYDDAISFMRNLLSGAYKDNTNLHKGVITGILRISKESIFTGLNNLGVYSILNTRFSDCFGFLEDEVKQILKDFNIETPYTEIKKWYDGYQFCNITDIYNPWSILNYVADYEDGFDTFWVNSSENRLVKEEIKKVDANEVRKDIMKLINNEIIEKTLEPNFVFPDLEKKKSLLWTLLTYSGNLTIKKQISRKRYELAIPNYEIKTIFQDTILEWLETDIKLQQISLEKTANYLINKDNIPPRQALSLFETGFKQIMGDTFSYYDNAKNNEYVFHSYILGLLAIIGDDYIIKSNRESGKGRYDIMLIPHDIHKNGVVIEIKQIEKQKDKESSENFTKRIEDNIQIAINQIDKNEYYKELIAHKIAEDKIIKVPIVFAGKEPYIIISEE